MVDFHGWSMPINYGSQINEHNCVRENCGIFDVSHMTILDFEGEDVEKFVNSIGNLIIIDDELNRKLGNETLYDKLNGFKKDGEIVSYDLR